MCSHCEELDAKIEKYRTLRLGFSDRQTLAAIDAQVEKLKAERKDLHPE
jgi:hypothetical protein